MAVKKIMNEIDLTQEQVYQQLDLSGAHCFYLVVDNTASKLPVKQIVLDIAIDSGVDNLPVSIGNLVVAVNGKELAAQRIDNVPGTIYVKVAQVMDIEYKQLTDEVLAIELNANTVELV